MGSALTRYRIMAYVVGVFLLLLVGVAMPVKYIGGNETLVSVIGPIHGFLYMVYLAAAFDLARKRRWSFPLMVGVLLAGTIPFLSFWVERKIVQREQAAARVRADSPA